MDSQKLKLVLCWHMHQPNYKDGLDGEYRLPWVYLHAIKDYTDMVAYLESCPDARVVVNFTPVLLDQLSEYAQQMRHWLDRGGKQAQDVFMSDGLLNLVSGAAPIPQAVDDKLKIISDCQRAYAPMMIDTLPDFRKLLDVVKHDTKPEVEDLSHFQISYLTDQFFIDLLMWYHIAWMGSALKKADRRVQRLMQKKGCFSSDDQRLLIEVIADAIEGVIPRYKRLQDNGQIEISMTPHDHPIVPLLIDFKSMRDAMPDAPMPSYKTYPGGSDRAMWHMQEGLNVFQRYFGCKPKGVWLSEGALSDAAINLLDKFNIQWTASGEGVWRHSYESEVSAEVLASKVPLYEATKLADKNCALFFRDDGLSDLIGFQYKDWKAEDAVDNFIHHLENIADNLGDEVDQHVVSVILDGENAWEYYSDNAAHFLTNLYQELSKSAKIEMTTFSEALASNIKEHHLSTLKAGSWVYGSFSTWIGEKDKNAAWDLLVEVKQTYDQVLSLGNLTNEQMQAATEQLAICEASDWFWWFGGYNPSDSVKDFDELYRRHLRRLYDLLGVDCPEMVDVSLSRGGELAENAGTMRRNA